ncbi:uncharacterized protein LOC122065263 isoform X2 [Macadamia integrifolia]|nr:uncharacterized protein LOC122065263 isoform X2 [Macadamia integrifolia]
MFINQFRPPLLTADNYVDWKEKTLFTLRCMNLDLALRVDEPSALTESSSPDEKAYYEKWEDSNRISLLFIEANVSKIIKGSIPKCTKVKDYLKAIDDKFVIFKKVLASTLVKKFLSLKYDGSKNMHTYIMEVVDIADQMKSVDMVVSESFVVHLILISLPMEYDHLRTIYNIIKEEWSISKLLSMCVQEEERLKNEEVESTHITRRGKGQSNKFFQKKNGKVPIKKEDNKDTPKCFFCQKRGHVKKYCVKYISWSEKKGFNVDKASGGT